jgi:hypothetical protein
MMPRLRLTLLVPAVTVAVYVIVYLLCGERQWFKDVEPFALQAVSSTGCVLGFLSFARGDYLRSAWRMFMIGDLLILFTVALTGLFPLESTVHVRVVATLITNVVSPIGAYRFAYAWRVAGIELPAGRLTRRSAILVGFVIGCVLAVPGIDGDLKMLSEGNLEALVYICGAVGDIASLALVAPIILTALALRGGRVAWVWSLLSVSILCWLAYDLVQGQLPEMTGFVEGVRVVALGVNGAAGLAQLMVTRPVKAPS